MRLDDFNVQKLGNEEFAQITGGCLCYTKDVDTGETVDWIVDGVLIE